ncbi:MAG: hypothetical protein RSB05_04070 [Clostridiales bacterium]
MAEKKNVSEKALVCSYYNNKEVAPKEGGDCYNFEPKNHDAYTCVGRACGDCYYSKNK